MAHNASPVRFRSESAAPSTPNGANSSFVKLDLLSTLNSTRTLPASHRASYSVSQRDRQRILKEQSNTLLTSLGLNPSSPSSKDDLTTPRPRRASTISHSVTMGDLSRMNGRRSKETAVYMEEDEEGIDEMGRTVRPASRTLSSRPSSRLSIAPQSQSRPSTAPSTTQPSTPAHDAELARLRERLTKVERERDDYKTKLAERESKGKVIGEREFAEMERQFAAQEALLSGYQKENERSIAELEKLRRLKKDLVEHVQRLYGDDWEREILRTSPTTTKSPHGVPFPRRNTSPMRSMSTLNLGLPSPPSSTQTSPNPASSAASVFAVSPILEVSPTVTQDATGPQSESSSKVALPGFEPAALLSHLRSVQLLVQGMEKRLISRSVELEAMEQQCNTSCLQ